MPDISMCANKECKKRFECTRFMAVPSEYAQPYIKPSEKKCVHFWDIKESPYPINEQLIKEKIKLIIALGSSKG